MTTLLVATRNRHKLEEVSSLLDGLLRAGGAPPIRVAGAEELPPGPPAVENGATFADNARLKAAWGARRALDLPPAARPRWVVADDSGLCVEALAGAPGVHSARYAGDGATDAENNARLLEALAAVPAGRRAAEFVCVLACIRLPGGAGAAEGPPRGEEGEGLAADFLVEGRCPGEIAFEPRGDGGFGYDPLFVVPELGKRFAELTGEEKNALSHRGQAVRGLGARILAEVRGEKEGERRREREEGAL